MIPAKLSPAQAGISSSGSAPQETGHEAWRTAWQKEMESMQASAWLRHGVVGGGLDAIESPKPQAAQAQRTAAQADSEQQPVAAQQPHCGRQLEARLGLRTQGGGRALPGPQVAFDLLPGAARPSATPAAAMNALVTDLRAALPGLQIQASASSPGAQVPQQTPPWDMPAGAMQARPGPANAKPQADPAAAKSEEAPGQMQAACDQRVERQALRLHAEWTDAGVRVWLGMDAAAAIHAAQLLKQLQRSLDASGCRLLSLTCNGHPVPLEPDGFVSSNFLKEMEAPHGH
jgi:hypothetical protein